MNFCIISFAAAFIIFVDIFSYGVDFSPLSISGRLENKNKWWLRWVISKENEERVKMSVRQYPTFQIRGIVGVSHKVELEIN